MKKSYPILIMLITLIFLSFIPSVKADIINGGFESGDWTGWTKHWYDSGSPYPFFEIQSTNPYEGTYNAMIRPDTAETGDIYQYVDITDYNYMTFYCKGNAGLSVTVGNDISESITLISTWNYTIIDISSETGNKKITFWSTSSSGWRYLYLDNIVLWEENPDVPDNSSISFIPNVDETNDTTRPDFNFIINDTDWNTYFSYRVYLQRCIMVDGEWNEYYNTDYWLNDNNEIVNYLEYSPYVYPPYITQDYTDTIYSWPCLYPDCIEGGYIMKFRVLLYGDIGGYINPFTLLASDTMIYDSNYTYSPPPSEIPTSIPTAEPTPTPTYTPFPTSTPTPIPTPDPDDEGITNYTINKSGMGTFYDSVNGTIETLNNTLNGVSDFFLIPTNGMTIYVNEVNTTFTNNTNQSIGHKTILTEIMIPFFHHFPLKIQLLISYYLTLLLILIILER